MAISEKFCLRWNDFETNVSVAFRELREEKDFFDVTLACEDSQIQAHKVILSACSPFFRNVLRKNPHQHPLLYLKGVKYKELLCVLNFMYQGEVNVAQEELNSFLAVAEDLRVKGLTQNNSSGESKHKTDQPKVFKPPPRDPQPREPVPPPKRSRPDLPPPPVNTYQQEEDDDIQEVMPVKSEPRDTTTTMSNLDTSVYSQQQPSTHQPSPAAQHATGGQDGALALDVSYADESYDHGQYEDGGYEDGRYEDGSGVLDPNTAMPNQDVTGADGNTGNHEIQRKLEIQQKIINTGPNMFQCADCGFSTAYKNSLVNHIEAKHMSGVYSCLTCGKQLKSKVALTMHNRQTHNDRDKGFYNSY